MSRVYLVVWCAVFLAACGEPSSSPQTSGESQPEQTASSDEQSSASGLEYYLETIPSPCSLITEAVVQNLLNVRQVVANPTNSGPESLNPRCAYRDGEQLGKFVIIVVVSTPLATFSSSMPTDQVQALVNQHFGESGMPYSVVDSGPGAQRFVAEKDDRSTMFVLTGLGVSGGAFDPTQIKAEVAFSVSLQDPARTAEARLTEARNLAAAYQSNLINAAKSR